MTRKETCEFIDKYWLEGYLKPHDCLIVGNTNTSINLGWYIFNDNQYYLTEKGENAIYNLYNN